MGKLLKTHGLNGEMSVMLDVDNPEDYREIEKIYIQIKGQLTEYQVEGVYFFQKKDVIKLKGVDKIEQAQRLLGCELYLPLSELAELEDGEFYFHDVIGFQVVDKNLGKLGLVAEFYESDTQTLLSMAYQGHEVLIPVHDDIVLEADFDEKTLITNLPNGLLEVYLNPSNTDSDDE